VKAVFDSGSPTPEIAGRDETVSKEEFPMSPLPFIVKDMNWWSGNFSEHVYNDDDEIQEKILSAKGLEYRIYGHCTSEQDIIDTSETGMSHEPVMWPSNRMYFFQKE
jgi:hypothetical protein